MDYIDWIISSFIFLITVALILVSVSNILPKNTTAVDVSKGLFINVIEEIPVYNISINNSDGEIYPYVLFNNTNGINQNLFERTDNERFGVLKDTDVFYNYGFQDAQTPYGILVLQENFNDFNYSDNFTAAPEANINAGILQLRTPVIITTNEEYYDYLGFLTTTADLIDVYVSYTDENNNHYCSFGENSIVLGKTENGEQTILEKTTDYSKTTDWHRVFFGYDRENKIICKTETIEINRTTESDIPKTQIVISTTHNNTLIDDFYIYLNNDLSINKWGLSANNFSFTVADNVLGVVIDKENEEKSLELMFSYNIKLDKSNNFIYLLGDEPMGWFFPQSKEFWIYINSDDSIFVSFYNQNNFEINNTKEIINVPVEEFPGDTYYTPLTFKSKVTTDDIISFDINLTKAFEEIKVPEESDPTNYIYYCDEKCVSLMYDIDYDLKSGIAKITIDKGQIAAENYFNLYFIYYGRSMRSSITGLEPNLVLIPEQNTSKQRFVSETKISNKFRVYNYLYPPKERTINFDFFTNGTNNDTNCSFDFSGNIVEISKCETNALLKIRYKETNEAFNTKIPIITKTTEKLITKEMFDSLSDQSYYLKLHNKVLNLENAPNRFTNTTYKNYSRFLWSNGFIEEIFVEIKPFN